MVPLQPPPPPPLPPSAQVPPRVGRLPSSRLPHFARIQRASRLPPPSVHRRSSELPVPQQFYYTAASPAESPRSPSAARPLRPSSSTVVSRQPSEKLHSPATPEPASSPAQVLGKQKVYNLDSFKPSELPPKPMSRPKRTMTDLLEQLQRIEKPAQTGPKPQPVAQGVMPKVKPIEKLLEVLKTQKGFPGNKPLEVKPLATAPALKLLNKANIDAIETAIRRRGPPTNASDRSIRNSGQGSSVNSFKPAPLPQSPLPPPPPPPPAKAYVLSTPPPPPPPLPPIKHTFIKRSTPPPSVLGNILTSADHRQG